MGGLDSIIKSMSKGIYEYATKFLPFRYKDSETGNSIQVEKMSDGSLRVTTTKSYDSARSNTEDDVTPVNIPFEFIERLLHRE